MWSYLPGVCINGALDHEERITCDQTFLLPFFSGKSDGQGRGEVNIRRPFPLASRPKKKRRRTAWSLVRGAVPLKLHCQSKKFSSILLTRPVNRSPSIASFYVVTPPPPAVPPGFLYSFISSSLLMRLKVKDLGSQLYLTDNFCLWCEAYQ